MGLEHIRQEFKIQARENKIDGHRQNSINRLDRMDDKRIRIRMLQYKPKGHRDLGTLEKDRLNMRPEHA
jgi:hypothetical protein